MLGATFAFSITAYSQKLVDDSEVTIQTHEDVIQKRAAIIQHVWGNDGFPSDRLPTNVILNDESPVPNLEGVERVDTFVIELGSDLRSYAHHFIPVNKNGRLVLLLHGHAVTFDDGTDPNDQTYGMRRTLQGLLQEGFSVMTIYMPRFAVFNTSISVNEPGNGTPHEDMFQKTPSTGDPMRYFLEPIAACINYALTQYQNDDFPEYTDINMVGFSGGGWATSVYAAVDTRVKLSISVAGSIPLYLRAWTSVGDREQFDAAFYSIAGYPDLYVLGSDGVGRKQVTILNRWDVCCFGQDQHNPVLAGGLPYDDAIRVYEKKVRRTLINLGNTDLFRVEIDEAAQEHTVTWDAVYDTILTELNGGRRIIGVDPQGDALARGAEGSPIFFANGVSAPKRIGQIIGAPDILKSAVHVNDAFFRTAANKLVHTWRSNFTWSLNRVLDNEAISDPVSVSLGPGRFSVVVQKNDYKLYRYSQIAGVDSVEVIDPNIRALGPATVLATKPNQLDVFFKGWDRQVYHARKIGNFAWETKTINGVVSDLPTAAALSDGTQFVFARDQYHKLLVSVRAPGSSTNWSNWTSITDMFENTPLINGSPSAYGSNNGIEVYGRSINDGIARFSYSRTSGTWVYTDLGGLNSDSPSAVPGGVFTRAKNGDLLLFKNQTWTDTGIPLD